MGGHPWMFFDLEQDPYEIENLIDSPRHADELARHHDLLRARLEETDDHFVLLPAWGRPGLNTWK